MSLSRKVLSCVLMWHVLALAVAAVPSSESLTAQPGGASYSDRPIARRVAPALDVAAGSIRAGAAILSSLTRPISGAARAYVGNLGIAHHWRMFSGPPKVHDYLRLRYYVAQGSASGVAAVDWFASELITPAHREDRVRLLKSYRDSSLDKAAMVALEQFDRHRQKLPEGQTVAQADLPDDLTQLTRYFARRFARDRLLPNERVVRSELWYGSAPMTPPGAEGGSGVPQERLEILSQYYDGPREYRGRVSAFPPFHAIQREGDITWVLKFFDE